ncbi:MAG TPA: FAD-dependent oxidoreductase [bacterium]|nr:FAD-dependent oxidoreductase [bacterium]HPN35621.1 FAD-dependent oxidoreductase [bacterium]
MRKAVVVGSGAGGAAAARELQGSFEVMVLEAGNEFKPLSLDLSWVDQFKRAGLLWDERGIQLLFPAMRIRKTADRMVMVNGIGTGGTTTLATANGIRRDHDLKTLGIDLDDEFAELSAEIPVTTDHRSLWSQASRRLFDLCLEMGLAPAPLAKMGDYTRCVRCGRCVLGCRHAAKWDSRHFLRSAVEKGARLFTASRVEKIVIRSNRATGVLVRKKLRTEFISADLVVVAAGGFGTPVILQNSGIPCEPRLFVDPVLCVAAPWEKAGQNKEISMPFVVERDGFILSPYFDYLSYFFNRHWKPPAQDTSVLMIKLADSACGLVRDGRIEKTLTDQDWVHLKQGVELCKEIYARLGLSEKSWLGTVNAGHPGGMLPLTAAEAATLHSERLPENVYVADATLFPKSLGYPPILTIMALAKKIAKICAQS